MSSDHKHVGLLQKVPSDDSIELQLARDTSKILIISSELDDIDRAAGPKSPLLKGMGLDLSFTTSLSLAKSCDGKDYEGLEGRGKAIYAFRLQP